MTLSVVILRVVAPSDVFRIVMLNLIMLSVVILNVIMPSVVAPLVECQI